MNLSELPNIVFNHISDLSGLPAYGAIIGVLLACGLGVPLPEDITLLAAGLLAANHQITVRGAIIAGLIGVLAGDAFVFYMGKHYGKKVFLLPGFRTFFTAERILAAEDKVRRNGPFICFIARFLPGLRTPVFATAGAMGVRPIVFFALDGIAALLSVPLWVWVGFWFGENWDDASRMLKRTENIILIAVVTLCVGYYLFRRWRRKRIRSITPSVTELKNSK